MPFIKNYFIFAISTTSYWYQRVHCHLFSNIYDWILLPYIVHLLTEHFFYCFPHWNRNSRLLKGLMIEFRWSFLVTDTNAGYIMADLYELFPHHYWLIVSGSYRFSDCRLAANKINVYFYSWRTDFVWNLIKRFPDITLTF